MGKLEEVKRILQRLNEDHRYDDEVIEVDAIEICKLFEQPIEGPMSQEDFLRRWRTNASNM